MSSTSHLSVLTNILSLESFILINSLVSPESYRFASSSRSSPRACCKSMLHHHHCPHQKHVHRSSTVAIVATAVYFPHKCHPPSLVLLLHTFAAIECLSECFTVSQFGKVCVQQRIPSLWLRSSRWR